MAKNLESLSKWLNHQSWTSGHPLDEARFYRAVYQVLKENKDEVISPEDVKDYVVGQFKGVLDAKFLQERANEAADRFEIISEFVAANKL
ncbi:hypothetical protein [Yersinia rohdei]|uniref:hypothetical protein n=1 Tax=Yersinia rohdei TaxID=29485 RepID=UPI0025AA67B1|nr:hypothetical protein [Yersinia rohdei]MDN0096574.1 hypothetical protein [Yersinia rohdei]